nr:fucolectin-1-like isoform X2 [Crassostrea gigas]
MRLMFLSTLNWYIGSTYSKEIELQQCTTLNLNTKAGVELIEEKAYPLWTNDYETYGAALYHCFPRCEKDERCVGIELCRIRPGNSRCRGCCEWFVNPHEGVPALKTSEVCRYIEDNKNYIAENGSNVALNASTTASSILGFESTILSPSKAVDGVTSCPGPTYIFSSTFEADPWLEINLQRVITIWRIIVHTRQDCCAERTVNFYITYGGNGQNNSCGFFPGPLPNRGDVLLFQCPPNARGSSVNLMIQSKPGETNWLSLCEVEILQKV